MRRMPSLMGTLVPAGAFLLCSAATGPVLGESPADPKPLPVYVFAETSTNGLTGQESRQLEKELEAALEQGPSARQPGLSLRATSGHPGTGRALTRSGTRHCGGRRRAFGVACR